MRRLVIEGESEHEENIPAGEQSDLNEVRQEEDDAEADRKARVEAQKAVLDGLSEASGVARDKLAAAFGWHL
jgi:hypothetical protein